MHQIFRILNFFIIMSEFLCSFSNNKMNQFGSIHGTVQDAVTHAPLISVNITVDSAYTGTASNHRGEFFLDKIPPGMHMLQFSMIGYEKFLIKNIRVESGRSTFRSINMTPLVLKSENIKIVANRYDRISDYNEIALKIPVPIQEIPVSVDIISREMIQDQSSRTLSDALKYTSSINVQGNLGSQDYFLIRGFESNSSGLILLDGVDEPDVSLYQFYGFGFFDLYNIERIEALKGPSAFLYGSNTLSGTVNLSMKRPLFDNFSEIAFHIGSYQDKRTSLDLGVADQNSKWAFRFNGLLHEYEHYRNPEKNRKIAVNPAFTWKFGNQTRLTFYYEYIDSEIQPDTGIPLYSDGNSWMIPKISDQTNYQSSFDLFSQSFQKFRIQFQSHIKNSIQIKNQFFSSYLNGRTNLTMSHMPFLDNDMQWKLTRHLYAADESQFFTGNQTDIHFKLHTGQIKHQLVAGFEIRKSHIQSNKGIKMLNHILYLSPDNDTDLTEDDINRCMTIGTETDLYNLAPYVAAYTTVSHHFKIMSGGRMDFIDFSTNRQNTPFDYISRYVTSQPAPYSNGFKRFSPTFGCVYLNSEELSFYTNIGQSYAFTASSYDQPEKSSQFEMGFKYQGKSKRFRMSAAIYRLNKDHITIPIQIPSEGTVKSSSGSQRSEGLEIEIQTQPFDNLYCFINYAYTDAYLTNYQAYIQTKQRVTELLNFSDNYAPFVPCHLFNLWMTKFINDRWGFGFGICHTGDQYISIENDFKLTGFWTFNAMLSFQINHLKFQYNLKNLSDTKFYMRGLGPNSVIPGNPREMNASIIVSL
ncbi:TonB-dependent receptor [bacterium]|nr:TonB-dependent receptor [bacterium]